MLQYVYNNSHYSSDGELNPESQGGSEESIHFLLWGKLEKRKKSGYGILCVFLDVLGYMVKRNAIHLNTAIPMAEIPSYRKIAQEREGAPIPVYFPRKRTLLFGVYPFMTISGFSRHFIRVPIQFGYRRLANTRPALVIQPQQTVVRLPSTARNAYFVLSRLCWSGVSAYIVSTPLTVVHITRLIKKLKRTLCVHAPRLPFL